MPISGDLTTVTVTGTFSSASGQPIVGTVTLTPSQTLLDPTSQQVIPAAGSSYPLSSMGTFQSDPLIATDNVDLEPQGWLYVVRVELQDLQPYSFTTPLPSSPSTVDISALEPVSVSIGSAPLTPVASGNYLPSGGGTETGTLVLGGPIPLKIPGATAGQTLVADASGNFTPQASPAGAATSIDGVSVTGITAAGRVIMAVDSANATWQLPLQLDTTDGDIKALAASGSAGTVGMGQASKADHVHPSTGLVDTTSTQTVAGTKTFTTAPTISGSVVNATDAATKAYVDASAAGLSIKLTVQAATTAALSPANTYANGTLGVGATLTATGNGTLTVDGHLVALNDRVLVKNEAAPANNGIYLCTTAGTVSVPYVLTRSTDMDTAAQVPGAFTFVVAGTANVGNSYTVAAGGPYTVGTTAIVFTLFSTPIAVTSGNSGISVTGSAVSLVTPVTIANGGTGTGTGAPQNDVFAGPATGGAGAPSFRGLVAADVPTLNQNTTGTAAGLSSTLAIGSGGTGTATGAPQNDVFAGPATGGAGAPSFRSLAVGDLPASSASGSYTNANITVDGAGRVTLAASGPGGGTSLDTTDNPAALGSANPSPSGGTKGAAPSDHVHPTTGLLTTGALVTTGQGGTGVNATSGSDALVQMAGSSGLPANAHVLRGNGATIQLTTLSGTDVPKASTGAQGAVTIEGTVGNIQASPGTASIGGTATTNPAYADHVHGQPPMLAPTGLTGATTPTRYIGGVSSAAPTGGTYVAGDYAVDAAGGGIWVCTTGSTPGPVVWAHIVAGSGVLTNPLTAVGDIIRGGTVTSGTAALTRLGIGSTGQVLTVSGGIPAWAAPSAGTDWLNAVTAYGADNTGATDASTAIQNALNAAPQGGTVYLPAGTYLTKKPIIVPPTITLLGSGRSLAYDGGSQPMTIGTSVLMPAAAGAGGFVAGTYNGQSVTGVLAFLGNSLGGYGGGYFSPSHSFTATNASPCVFTAAGSAYVNGTQVVLTGASMPAGFTADTIYFVVSASGTTFQLSATSGGAAKNSTSTGSGTVKQEFGSANQTVRNITINGVNMAPGGAFNGIEAWGPVWGVKLEDVGIFHMPQDGIATNQTAFGSDTAHFPDFWQLIGVHSGGNHRHGINMASIGDSYFVACESTGNAGNGWNLSPSAGDNIKIIGCKAEYNGNTGLGTGIGLLIARGGSTRPILISNFGTDGNYQHGIQITGTGAGPVVLTGCGLNYDGQNNGAGGNFAALSITGAAHVSATGLHVTTGLLGATNLFPQYGIQCPSTFTGVLQIENSEIYGGTAAVNLAVTATGTVRYGPDVLTGSGNWATSGGVPTLTNVVHAPSPQTDAQQYAKYWSPGSPGGWVTSTAQQPRESMPWYAVSGNPTIASGQMLCAVIPVMPGDQISKLGFVVGGTAASLTAGGSGPHWWVALYTTGGAALIGQSADQGAATLLANTPHLLSLTAASGFTIPYLVPAGTYSLLGVVMVNSNAGTQPTLRGISQQAVLNGGSGDLFPGSTTYAATVGAAGSNGGASPPAGPLTLAVATSFAYLGAC